MKKFILSTAVILFLVIAVLPLAFLLGSAFWGNPDGLRQLGALYLDPRVGQLMFNSASVAVGSTVLALLFGVPVGFLLARTDVYARGLALWVILIPLLIPDYILATSWAGFLGNNSILRSAFRFEQDGLSLYNHWGVIWVLGTAYYPIIALLMIAGLGSLNKKLEEQGLLMTSPGVVLRRITLPLVVPHIMAGGLFVFILSSINYGVPSLLGVNTYPLEIFAQFSVFYDHQKAIVTCLPLLLVTVPLMIACYLIMKDRFYVSFDGNSVSPLRTCLKGWRSLSSFYVWMVILCTVVLPVVVLVKGAGSFTSYVAAFKTSYEAIWTSLILSVLGATMAVVLGIFAGYVLERGRGKWRRLFDIMTLVPLAVPPTVLGIGLICLWNRPATAFIYSSAAIVVLGMVARFIPFVIRIQANSLKQLHPNMEEAATLNGISFFKMFWRILIPMSRKGLFISWAICFIFCMGELGMTLLVVPAGYETLGNKVYTLLHYGVGRLTSALGVIMVIATILPLLLLMGLLHTLERKR